MFFRNMKFWIKFKKLLKNSVITGVPQIVLTRNMFRKSIKLIVFTGCVFGFLWQTSSFLEVYWSYPTVVDVQYSFPSEFELPAISICSYNGIKSGLFCRKFPHLCSPPKNLTKFCNEYSHLCDLNYNPGNESFPVVPPRDFPPLSRIEYREMGTQADEMVERCGIFDALEFQNCTGPQIVNVFDIKALPTNCYTYNGLWGKTNGAKKINTKSMLLLTVSTARTQTNQFYTGSPFALQMSLHTPYGIHNPFFQGFAIKPCFNYHIFPSLEVNVLLPPPYTSACFNYSKMWHLRSGKSPLTKRLCTEECLLEESIEHFGCVDPYFISYPNMEPICPERMDRDLFSECKNQCPPACYSEHIFSEVQELSLSSFKHGAPKDKKCRSIVTVSFNRVVYITYTYSPKYESVSLFSYVGGYLGLWLGISLVAICDVIETVILIGQWVFKSPMRNRSKNKVLNFESPVMFKGGPGEMWIL